MTELAVHRIKCTADSTIDQCEYTINKAIGLLHNHNTLTCAFTHNTITQPLITEDLILLDGMQ